MPLCPYGSGPKTGAPPYVWLTWLDGQSWLGSVFAKLSFLSYLVPPVLKEINNFCATDPPQPIAPSDADIVAAAYDPVKFEKLIQYLKDSIYWWVWANNCVCNSGSPPVCPSPWASSQALTDLGPSGSSFGMAMLFTPQQSGLDFTGWEFWTPQALNYAVGCTLWTSAGPTIVIGKTFASGVIGAGHSLHYADAAVSLANGTQYAVSYCLLIGYDNAQITGTPTANALLTYDTFDYGGCSTPFDHSGAPSWPNVAPVVCASGATTPASPPVPTLTTPNFPLEASCTTQDVCDLIQQTLQSVTLLRSMVDLVQRRLLPFAWILGTPHTGLTGTGVISVQDVLGADVSMTVPGGWGSTAETPRRLIPSAGSLQGSDGTSYSDNFQLHYEHELIFFGQSWSTGIRYNFRPGVTATLTPLLPEP
jgi:hypothetical protein